MNQFGIGGGSVSGLEALLAIVSDPAAAKARLQELKAAEEAHNKARDANQTLETSARQLNEKAHQVLKEAQEAARKAAEHERSLADREQAVRVGEARLHDAQNAHEAVAKAKADELFKREKAVTTAEEEQRLLRADLEARLTALKKREAAADAREAKLKAALQ